MTSVSPHAPKDKPHYTYILGYPEDYPELDKAGTVFYVGKGKRARIHDHERQARTGVKSHKCNIIRKIWASGKQVAKRKLAYFKTHEEACMYEIALIFFMDGLTNLTEGGDGTVGLSVQPSEKTRLKLSIIQKTSPYAAEARRILHESHKGRKRPEGTGQKISKAKKKKGLSPCSEAHLHKLHETSKGCKQPLEHVQKRAASNTGKSRSEETKQNMRVPHPKLKGRTPWNKGIHMWSEEERREIGNRQRKEERATNGGTSPQEVLHQGLLFQQANGDTHQSSKDSDGAKDAGCF